MVTSYAWAPTCPHGMGPKGTPGGQAPSSFENTPPPLLFMLSNYSACPHTVRTISG